MRLIDADALIEDLQYDVELDARALDGSDIVGDREAIQFDKDCKQNCVDLLRNAPTVDPVKHGRWIYYEDETIEDGGRCSVCQCDQPVFWEDWEWKFVETAYCPNCGAKMDEEG